MIFVVLGTQKFQMNRLLMQIDGLIAEGKLTTPVTAQIGQSDYLPKHYFYQRFFDKPEFEKNISEAEIVISHCGAGTVIAALKKNKPVIAYPRLAKYGEHVDNHQLEIASAFAKKGYVLLCDEKNDLYEQIVLCKEKTFTEFESKKNEIVRLINDYLEKL